MLRYETQRVAFWYFAVAMALFLGQLIFGVLAGTIYVFPNLLAETLPFSVIRMIHTNLLIVWLLLGFFGATYYLLPEETERELWSRPLALLQLVILTFAGAAAVVGYVFRIYEGREFLEQPTWVKAVIALGVVIFMVNVTMTYLRGRRTAVGSVLLLGLWGATIFYLFAFYNPSNLVVDKLYWWYVVHLWVEGVWELIMAALLAFLLIKLTGVDREVIEKWMYVVVGLSLISGLLGTGHHYFWIGLPAYWQWVGSIFSVLEVLPFFAMVLWAFYMVYQGRREHPNRAALLWSLGTPVLAFFGAGVWGFMHTLHWVNYYSHGTQVTAAHGHLAFYGAYVAINLAIITYAMPSLRGVQPYNQILNMWSFWIMSSAMFFMAMTLTFAGAVQTHLQRVMGMFYMEVQDQLMFFYIMRLTAGAFVLLGALLFVVAIFGPVRAQVTRVVGTIVRPPAPAG